MSSIYSLTSLQLLHLYTTPLLHTGDFATKMYQLYNLFGANYSLIMLELYFLTERRSPVIGAALACVRRASAPVGVDGPGRSSRLGRGRASAQERRRSRGQHGFR